MIRLQLLLRHQVRGAAHEVMTSKGLGEGYDITDAWCPDHNGDQTVQTCKKNEIADNFHLEHHKLYISLLAVLASLQLLLI